MGDTDAAVSLGASPMARTFSSLPLQRALIERLPQSRRVLVSPSLFRARGTVDLAALERSVQLLVEHRPALRTALVARDGGWVQQLTDEPARIAPIHAPTGRMEEILDGWNLALEALDWSRGRNVVVSPITSGRRAGCDRFGLVVSHMATDGMSWQVFLRNLSDVYERFARGEEPALVAEATTVQAYAERLAEAARAGRWDGELPHWRETVRAARASRGLGGDDQRDATRRIFSGQLAPALWEGVRAGAERLEATYVEAVWTAIVLSLQEELELDGLLVHLFHHGRSNADFAELDLRRTLGAIAVTHPSFVPRLPASLRDATAAMTEHLRTTRTRVADGVGYWMLRERHPELTVIDPMTLGRNGVSLNWIGPYRDAELFRESGVDPAALGVREDLSPLGIGVTERNESLSLVFEHLPAVLPAERIAAIWSRCLATFERIAAC